ncbi:hypothetical protein INR49_014578, partial [Caranx melampygus]
MNGNNTKREHERRSKKEYQSCNTLPCPDLKKTTPWTPWTPVNISDNGDTTSSVSATLAKLVSRTPACW